MASQNDNNVHITAQCLCKTHTFTAVVQRSSLPLGATTCHCDSCRHLTGAMYSNDIAWPGDYEAIRTSTLKTYDFSKVLQILYCGTCSSTMFWDMPQRKDGSVGGENGRQYGLFTGCLVDDGPQGLVKMIDHMFVGDTIDGGASLWMRKPNGDGQSVPRWSELKHTSEKLADDWPAMAFPTADWKSGTEEIPFRCHCKGVNLVFQSGQALREYAAMEAQKLPWFVDPVSRKPVVGTDACKSCRTSFGIDFVNWTFAFLKHVAYPTTTSTTADDAAEFPKTVQDLYAAVSTDIKTRDPRLGTLAVYRSSEGVKRYFCSRCSACVFYANDKNGVFVDIAMGLFDVEKSRAEGTFLWLFGGPFKHRGDVQEGWRGDWLKSLEAGSEELRKERDFPEWWKLGR
ncbi:hypothetical protein M406DRAFT_267186 [Cryphonectria parasitica EP155]|uniref:CENP-V/GFA domain-containing protein n=1 Tax=Cryphonectria parasitica (strain ATCC 38755 / EP155) TaxID=660469 RepID=A0A9P4XUH4_CRYP1|nr:uncharacterized protein M406DRAFT_267186 [Cryphonectria parasitica EP155]KAF3760975.1 hypothetical protein M406DRAFT_267186 [Cryphonectria parasitica EP155]